MNKILYISPFIIYPPANGGARYIYNFIYAMSEKNTILYAGVKNQQPIPLPALFRQENIFPHGIQRYLHPFPYIQLFFIIKHEKPDVIIVAMPYQVFFVILLAKIQNIPCYVHEQNIEFLRFQRMGKWWWRLLYWYERLAYKLVDKILCISRTDKNYLIHEFHMPAKKLKYSPYQVDTIHFQPNSKAGQSIKKQLGFEKNSMVLFFGPLDYQPNTEAVNAIVNHIAPAVYKKNKQILFVLAGKNPPGDMHGPNIFFPGFVEKIEDYINASDIVIVPLLSGGGVRTKILESLACGKQVISTTIGAEGIAANKKLHVVDGWDNFAKAIIHFI